MEIWRPSEGQGVIGEQSWDFGVGTKILEGVEGESSWGDVVEKKRERGLPQPNEGEVWRSENGGGGRFEFEGMGDELKL